MKKVLTVHRFPAKVMRGCVGKTRHASEGKADAAARAVERLDQREGRRPHPVHSYFCVRCKGWHVGHA
jgi:hypothetical protein